MQKQMQKQMQMLGPGVRVGMDNKQNHVGVLSSIPAPTPVDNPSFQRKKDMGSKERKKQERTRNMVAS